MSIKFIFICLMLLVLLGFSHVVVGLELKTAMQNSAPKYFVIEKNGKKEMKGLCIDIMRAIEKVSPNITFIADDYFTPTARIWKYLEQGEIDVYVGAGSNKERQKKR